jgi:ribosomal protein S17
LGREKGGKTMKTINTKQNPLTTPKEVSAMRVGDVVQIKRCPAIPEVVGENAEIMALQIQEFDEYAVYPVWVRMLSGARKGKVYGFQRDEVGAPTEAVTEKTSGRTLVEQVEEILKGATNLEDITAIESLISPNLREGSRKARTGDLVKIKQCLPIPEVVGEDAELVELQTQDFERYTAYPVWVKMLSGERKGKIYGFQYDEVEMLPKLPGVQTAACARNLEVRTGATRTKVVEQVEEILRGATTMEDFAEIERVISEAKGKFHTEPVLGFWERKTPCWEMFRCPEAVKNECPASLYRTLPCWQIEGTYSKLHDYGKRGDGTEICQNCRVYKRWGQGEPVAIKLYGKGFDTAAEKPETT